MSPNNYVPVYKSELAPMDHATAGYKWNKVSVLTSTLCKEEDTREIRIDFYKSMKNGRHINLGFVSTNLGMLRAE